MPEYLTNTWFLRSDRAFHMGKGEPREGVENTADSGADPRRCRTRDAVCAGDGKTTRLHSVTSTIENGFVYLPTEAEWLSSYLHELTTFPNSKHDDQADATSQALDWTKANPFAA